MYAADAPPSTLAANERPAIVAPGPRQASFGRVIVSLAPRTERVTLYVNDEVARERTVTQQVMRFTIALPRGDSRLRVVAHYANGGSRADSVEPVLGLPRAGRPTGTKPQLEWLLQRRLRKLADEFPGTPGFYVMNLRTGLGAGWNARARFPAASTVKLAIAVEVLRRLSTIPRPDSALGYDLRRMLVFSSNKSANELLEWLGGSQTAGASQVTSMLHRVGLMDTYMYGGYIIGTSSHRPIPLNVVSQPSFTGKYTSAWDLARLHQYVHRASTGHGPLITRLAGFTRAEARHLLYQLGHSVDHGKLDRFVKDEAIAVPHKAGWITTARHDAGIVYWAGGAFVAAVMTWNGNGVTTTSDVLAGRMARSALDRFEALRQAARSFALERGASA
jgi:hypothetical protein